MYFCLHVVLLLSQAKYENCMVNILFSGNWNTNYFTFFSINKSYNNECIMVYNRVFFHYCNCTCSWCRCKVEKKVLAIICLKTKYPDLLYILLLFKKRGKYIYNKKSVLLENHRLAKFRCGRIMKLRQKSNCKNDWYYIERCLFVLINILRLALEVGVQ